MVDDLQGHNYIGHNNIGHDYAGKWTTTYKEYNQWNPSFGPAEWGVEKGMYADHMLAFCNKTGLHHVAPFVNFRKRPSQDVRQPLSDKGCTQATPWFCSTTESFTDGLDARRGCAYTASFHIDVLIIDMTSRFMALQRLPRTIRLLESLGRHLDTGMLSFEFTEFTAIGYGTGPNVGTLLIGTPTNDHKVAHINVIFNDAGYVSVAQSELHQSFGSADDPYSVLSHALHGLDYECGLGAPWNIKPAGLDLDQKKIAGAFTTDHMFHYLQLVRYSTLAHAHVHTRKCVCAYAWMHACLCLHTCKDARLNVLPHSHTRPPMCAPADHHLIGHWVGIF